MPGTKNDQVIKDAERNLHGPKEPDLVVKMSMAGIKDAAASSLEAPSCLINQKLQDESTDESAGHLPQLATVKVFLSLANKYQPS